MIRRDYYVILGVDRGESQRGIRDAYHHLALRFHPDRAGEQSTELFREIVEAYQTLSDPQARRSYDRGLEHAARKEGTRPPIITPPDPVTPTVLGPLSELRDFQVVQASPSLEQILERIERNFSGLGVPKSERTAPLDLTLVLSPEEAARGGLLRFGVPVYYPCPACHGTGDAWPWVCQICSGHGMVIEREQIAIHVPALVEDGTIFEVPLRGLGVHNLYLRVWTRVAA
ncbi:MAG TPA: DnaJ domain-containing protein [Gemmatimonadales bacterium]|nr:DnaJ domain-containing protein [Gemmatimonadales bacterium]